MLPDFLNFFNRSQESGFLCEIFFKILAPSSKEKESEEERKRERERLCERKPAYRWMLPQWGVVASAVTVQVREDGCLPG